MTGEAKNEAQRRATAAMEAESRAWMVRCRKCGAERSVWDTGGIRYRAAGTSYNYRRCPACGKSGWQKIYWKDGVPGAAPASAAFVVRLVVSIVLGVLLATGLILFIAFKLAGIM